ncbi:MAG: hypothetical protein ACM3UO_00450 [Bacillota bacterium]
MHTKLTLLGLGAAGGFTVGRFPRQTRDALDAVAARLMSKAARHSPEPETGTREGFGTVIAEPFPTADPLVE